MIERALLDESAAVLDGHDMLDAAAARPRFVTFRAGDDDFAIAVERVREVVRADDITRVPASPDHVRGLAPLRGRLVPVIDVAVVLGGSRTTVTAHARLVTVDAAAEPGRRDGERLVALLVSAVGAVASPYAVDDDDVSARGRAVVGAGLWRGRRVRFLDVDRLVEGP